MAKPLTTSKLIDSVKQRAMLPTNDKTFSEDDFIEILNEEMDTGIVPEVLRQHEEYYTVFEDVAMESGKVRYRIPYRAVGNKLRDLAYVDSAGNISELSRISLEELSEYQSNNVSDIDEVFYLESNEVVFPRLAAGTGTLRFYFHLRPNSLVTEDKVGKITGINRTTGLVTVDNFPTNFSNLPLMDFISYQSPNRIEAYDIQPSAVNVTSKEITFNVDDIPTELKVGDYVCEQQETIIPQIPVEMHTMLAQKAAIYCLEALNDSEGLANAQRKMERMEKDIDVLINNRVEGAPRKVFARQGTLQDSVNKTGYRKRY